MSEIPADINYTFSDAELDQLRSYGEVRYHKAGEVLVEPGEREVDMLVTISGETHIFVESAEETRRVGWMEAGQFAGDISILTGKASLARTVMGQAGEVLHIPYRNFRRLLVENSRLSDVFVRTLSARRAFALSRRDASVMLLGTAEDRNTYGLRRFLAHHSVPHSWLDVDVDPIAGRLARARDIERTDLPALVLGESRIVRNATVSSVAEVLGLDSLRDRGTADVVVVGAGPAGLAACVYAASEGLDVIVMDEEGPGGQAGHSSKIENYLGFPLGISGRELADRAAVQAQKFGVELVTATCANALELLEDGRYLVGTDDGRSVRTRSIVIAAGARYRKLAIDDIERYEGQDIHYGASPLEAQLCASREVAVVGAGNSAGQGALYLSEAADRVHVLFRRADIRETMSEYLVRRLEESGNVVLHPATEITALFGSGTATPNPRLAGIEVQGPEGRVRLDATLVFLFIGAAPLTGWLPARITKDERGFVCTGQQIDRLALVRARWSLDRLPTPFETSLPRVYAIGDVRVGSVKRVASAVGEGAVVVSAIHRALAADI